MKVVKWTGIESAKKGKNKRWPLDIRRHTIIDKIELRAVEHYDKQPIGLSSASLSETDDQATIRPSSIYNVLEFTSTHCVTRNKNLETIFSIELWRKHTKFSIAKSISIKNKHRIVRWMLSLWLSLYLIQKIIGIHVCLSLLSFPNITLCFFEFCCSILILTLIMILSEQRNIRF